MNKPSRLTLRLLSSVGLAAEVLSPPLLPPGDNYSSLAPLTGEAEPVLFNSSFYLGIRLSRQTIEAGCNKQTNLNTRATEIGQCCDPRSTLWSAVATSMEQSVLCVYTRSLGVMREPAQTVWALPWLNNRKTFFQPRDIRSHGSGKYRELMVVYAKLQTCRAAE